MKWCKHIRFIKQPYNSGFVDGYWINFVFIQTDWKFCPICGAKRPPDKQELNFKHPKVVECKCPKGVRTVRRIFDGLVQCPRCGGYTVIKPKVVLPERIYLGGIYKKSEICKGWNACLDRLIELNPWMKEGK